MPRKAPFTFVLIATVAGCLAAASTSAREGRRDRPAGPPPDLLETLDEDGDGRLSKDEIFGRERALGRLDTDGDGYIDAEELRAATEDTTFVQRLDRDGDELVSRDEFDGPPEHFERFDRDGDGFISGEEAPTGPPPGARGRRPARRGDDS